MAGCAGRLFTLLLTFTMTLKGGDYCCTFEETEAQRLSELASIVIRK